MTPADLATWRETNGEWKMAEGYVVKVNDGFEPDWRYVAKDGFCYELRNARVFKTETEAHIVRSALCFDHGVRAHVNHVIL